MFNRKRRSDAGQPVPTGAPCHQGPPHGSAPVDVRDETLLERAARVENVLADIRKGTVETRDPLLLAHLVVAWPTTNAQNN